MRWTRLRVAGMGTALLIGAVASACAIDLARQPGARTGAVAGAPALGADAGATGRPANAPAGMEAAAGNHPSVAAEHLGREAALAAGAARIAATVPTANQPGYAATAASGARAALDARATVVA